MAPPLFAINFPASGHTLTLMDWIFSRAFAGDSGELLIRRHGDEDLYRANLERPVWFTIVDTDILLSTSEEVVLSGIERLRRPPGAIADLPLQALMAEAPADAALTFAAREGGAGILLALVAEHVPALADMLRRQMDPEARVSAWARLESQDRLNGRLLVANPSPAPDRPHEAEERSTYTLELLDGAVRLTLADTGMDSTAGHEWAFSLDGLEALTQWAAVCSSEVTTTIKP